MPGCAFSKPGLTIWKPMDEESPETWSDAKPVALGGFWNAVLAGRVSCFIFFKMRGYCQKPLMLLTNWWTAPRKTGLRNARLFFRILMVNYAKSTLAHPQIRLTPACYPII